MASTSSQQASIASRFGSLNSVYVSSDGQDSVEISLDQLTPAAIARVFSVSFGMAIVWKSLSHSRFSESGYARLTGSGRHLIFSVLPY